MLESIAGSDAVAGIKNVRPVMSPAVTQRLVQLSHDLTVSRSAPGSPQGQSNSFCHYPSTPVGNYPRRARSALGVDIVLTLDVFCMFVCYRSRKKTLDRNDLKL